MWVGDSPKNELNVGQVRPFCIWARPSLERLRRLRCLTVIRMSQGYVQAYSTYTTCCAGGIASVLAPGAFVSTARGLWEQMAMVPLPGRALLEGVSCVFFLTAVGLRKTQCLGLKYVWRGLRRWYRLYAGPWGLRATSQQLREQVARLQRGGQYATEVVPSVLPNSSRDETALAPPAF